MSKNRFMRFSRANGSTREHIERLFRKRPVRTIKRYDVLREYRGLPLAVKMEALLPRGVV